MDENLLKTIDRTQTGTPDRSQTPQIGDLRARLAAYLQSEDLQEAGNEVLRELLCDLAASLSSYAGMDNQEPVLEMMLEQLEAERARLSTIFANAPEAIVVADQTGKVVLTNHLAEQFYGPLVPFELGANPPGDPQVYHPDGIPYNPRDLPLTRSALDGITHVNLEVILFSANGQRRNLLVNSAPILDKKGKINGAVAIIHDITQHKQAEEEMLQHAARIEIQHHLMESREKERLQIARDLHDGPLQELYGMSYAVREMMGAAKEETMFQKLHAVFQTLDGQINEMRSFCSELRPPVLTPFGLVKSIQAHVETFRAKHPELVFELDLQPDEQILSEQTRLALYRIYQELLNNIVRHAKAQHIWVRFSIDENQIRLSMQDDGAGFVVPPNWVDMVRQGHLGLAGAQERAEAIGGFLKIISSPGEGTVIRVIVPLLSSPEDKEI